MPGDATVDDQQTVEELQAELAKVQTRYEKLQQAHATLKGDLGELKELQAKVDTLTSDNSKLLKEKEDIAAEFSTFAAGIKEKSTKEALTSALEKAGVRSTSTSFKLIDKSKLKYSPEGEVLPESIEETINELRTSDPELFKSDAPPPSTPAVKHAVDRVTKGAYEAELAAAVKAGDQKMVDEVFEKYHRNH